MILWAGYDQGTCETRDTWNFQWDVDFKPPHLSKEQVFASFDELDSKAPPTTTNHAIYMDSTGAEARVAFDSRNPCYPGFLGGEQKMLDFT